MHICLVTHPFHLAVHVKTQEVIDFQLVQEGGLSSRTSPSATLLRASVRLGVFV